MGASGSDPAGALGLRSPHLCPSTLNVLKKKTHGPLAGMPEDKHHVHVLKHSITTPLSDAGADLQFVQDWVGHASIENTLIDAQFTSCRRDEEAR